MRVLMLSRVDVNAVPGGDTIQMLQTKRELEALGVQVRLGTIGHRLDAQGYDLIHIYNWEQLEPFLQTCKTGLDRIPPIVLSTIFWFHSGQWYGDAVTGKRAWRIANAALGMSRSRTFYEQWQQAKFRWGSRGRNLRRQLSVPARLLPNSFGELRHLEVVLGLQGHLRQKCTIVPNGVSRNMFDPLPEPNKDFVNEYGLGNFVLQVARIQAAKNQLGLIEALSDTSFPIVFVGPPSPYEKAYVDRCYEQARRRGNVYFVSPKTPQELAGIYVLAAVHVLPSWRETPGLASLEAAAAGCRLVTTVSGSTREYFGDDAWYCDPRDKRSIRDAVLAALESPSSEKLRARILERFTWDIAAKSTLEAYRKAIG
jgi:glycosyltransferase involved in cell wall biosynthesis